VDQDPAVVQEPAVVMAASEPDWRQATWHAEPEATLVPETAVAEILVPEMVDGGEEPTVTVEPVRETLRSLFDTPASLAKAAQLEMQRHLDEPIAEVEAPMVPITPMEEIEETATSASEPVVRIRVLNNGVAAPAETGPVAEAEVLAEVPWKAAPVAEVAVEEQEEALPVMAPVDFLTAADLGEAVAP